MRTASATYADLAASVVPPIVCNQPDDVAAVTALEGLRVSVTFVDGTAGVVDLSRLVHSDRAGVFAALRDPAIFSQVHVNLGAVTWPGELDLAPDAMYEALRTDGVWRI